MYINVKLIMDSAEQQGLGSQGRSASGAVYLNFLFENSLLISYRLSLGRLVEP